MRTELEAEKNKLINKINKLEAKIAKQKSVTSVRQIAKELNVITKSLVKNFMDNLLEKIQFTSFSNFIENMNKDFKYIG